MPPTLKSLQDALEAALAALDPHTAGADARYILQKRAGVNWAEIIANPGETVNAGALTLIESDLAAALSGVPLGRIYGEREFYGLDFELSAATLEPRPDTEILVGLALSTLKNLKNPRILDLGTGSGCILVAILKNHPGATGIGVDRAEGAAHTARRNARRHGVGGRAAFLCGNWADSVNDSFDLVVSNPPYISNQSLESLPLAVKNHDPILALDGGEEGMQAYKEIFLQLPRLVKTGGSALFEIGFDQAENIARLSKESRFTDCRVHLDSGGLPRVAALKIF